MNERYDKIYVFLGVDDLHNICYTIEVRKINKYKKGGLKVYTG